MAFTRQSDVGKINGILLKHPEQAFVDQATVDAQWESLHYTARPDFTHALAEYEVFVNLLKSEIDNVHLLPAAPGAGLDSIYVRDSMIMTEQGGILCNMGKEARINEPSMTGDFLTQIGQPILGSITGEGQLEGGDLIWLDERTLVIGCGYRTNEEGIRQLRDLTWDLLDELIVVPLPHWNGPDDVMHLMSFISPIDHDLAVVYSRLMPVPFREILLDRGIELVEVPDEEFESMGCNILALAPRRCLMIAGNNETKRRLVAAGVEVLEYVGKEISLKGCGGPTCLTRPLEREGRGR